jgi:hypothetical protein
LARFTAPDFFTGLSDDSSSETSFLVARFAFFAAGGDSALGAFFLAPATDVFFFKADEIFLVPPPRFLGTVVSASRFSSCVDLFDSASSGTSVALLLVDMLWNGDEKGTY